LLASIAWCSDANSTCRASLPPPGVTSDALFLHRSRAAPATVRILHRSHEPKQHRCLHSKRHHWRTHPGYRLAVSEQGACQRDGSRFQGPLPVYRQHEPKQDLHVHRESRYGGPSRSPQFAFCFRFHRPTGFSLHREQRSVSLCHRFCRLATGSQRRGDLSNRSGESRFDSVIRRSYESSGAVSQRGHTSQREVLLCVSYGSKRHGAGRSGLPGV